MKRTTIVISIAILVVSALRVEGVFASTTNGVIPAASYAWGENFGWINFGCTNCGISVTDSAVTGDAWSANYGWINMAPSKGGVTNDGNGNLGGNAWSSGLGWISFSGVVINSSGKFTGIAGTQGTTAGRINFSCTNCGVTTDWRPASVRNGNSNNNGGNANNSNNSGNSGSGSGSSVSSSGSFLPGFLNLFNNNPFGNAVINANNVNSTNNVNPVGANPNIPSANGGQSLNPLSSGTLSQSPFATSTVAMGSVPKAHKSDQPLPIVGSSSYTPSLSVLVPAIAAGIGIIVILVILILRFL